MSIEVTHISKSFGTFRALDDVSLKIADGELVALLGPSGSGKTTLLRIMAGMEAPDATSGAAVRLYEEDVANHAPRDRQVGFVFQHYALFRHMTVFENIAFGLRVRPRRERLPAAQIREKVEELLSLIQLQQFGNRYPSQLSGGQRQRVALARALAVEPKVLLLDEPFGALDAKVRQDLRQWLRTLHSKMHVTTVLVTHDQEEALEVADRVVVMNHGRIEQAGTPDELFHNPQTPFVMEFLGQVNVFHGRAHHGKAVAGPLSVDIDEYAGAEELPAKVYLRPHDFEIHRERQPEASLEARIVRIHSAGPLARVSLVTTDGQTVLVEVDFQQLGELQLAEGEQVHLTPRKARVFFGEEPSFRERGTNGANRLKERVSA